MDNLDADIPADLGHGVLAVLLPRGALVVYPRGRWAAVKHAWPLTPVLGTILGVDRMLMAAWSERRRARPDWTPVAPVLTGIATIILVNV
ncbi:MAG: hypothetical protein ACXVWW_11465 [Nocardioides sp.]